MTIELADKLANKIWGLPHIFHAPPTIPPLWKNFSMAGYYIPPYKMEEIKKRYNGRDFFTYTPELVP